MADLSSMTLVDLRRRAADVGVPASQIEDARDGDDPKRELIALITAAAPPLSSLGVGELRRRAASAGVPAHQIEDARDSDDPKSALIALITSGGKAMRAPAAVVATAVPQQQPMVNIVPSSPQAASSSGGPRLTPCRTNSVWILGIIYVRGATGCCLWLAWCELQLWLTPYLSLTAQVICSLLTLGGAYLLVAGCTYDETYYSWYSSYTVTHEDNTYEGIGLTAIILTVVALFYGVYMIVAGCKPVRWLPTHLRAAPS
jgi:hypothetical protein